MGRSAAGIRQGMRRRTNPPESRVASGTLEKSPDALCGGTRPRCAERLRRERRLGSGAVLLLRSTTLCSHCLKTPPSSSSNVVISGFIFSLGDVWSPACSISRPSVVTQCVGRAELPEEDRGWREKMQKLEDDFLRELFAFFLFSASPRLFSSLICVLCWQPC